MQLILRIDPDVLDHYRATGEGWQRRMNDALRAAAKLDHQQAPAVTIVPQRRRAGR